MHQIKASDRKRRRRHQMLSKRTAKGQPVTKYVIKDLLSKLQKEE